MQVWDEGGNGYVRYSAAEVGRDNMGYVAENRVLQAALMRRLKDLENVTLLWPVGCSQTHRLAHFRLPFAMITHQVKVVMSCRPVWKNSHCQAMHWRPMKAHQSLMSFMHGSSTLRYLTNHFHEETKFLTCVIEIAFQARAQTV